MVRPQAGATIDDCQVRIIEEMSALGGGIEKYRYLIERGRRLDTRGGQTRREENRIRGCQSSVWIEVEARNGRLEIHGDSDAMIVRGIMALLLSVLDRQPAEVVARADLYFIERTGLHEHLSPHRANGLAAMVEHVRDCARRQLGPASAPGEAAR